MNNREGCIHLYLDTSVCRAESESDECDDSHSRVPVEAEVQSQPGHHCFGCAEEVKWRWGYSSGRLQLVHFRAKHLAHSPLGYLCVIQSLVLSPCNPPVVLIIDSASQSCFVWIVPALGQSLCVKVLTRLNCQFYFIASMTSVMSVWSWTISLSHRRFSSFPDLQYQTSSPRFHITWQKTETLIDDCQKYDKGINVKKITHRHLWVWDQEGRVFSENLGGSITEHLSSLKMLKQPLKSEFWEPPYFSFTL